MAKDDSSKSVKLTREAFPTAAKALAATNGFTYDQLCTFWDEYGEALIQNDCSKKKLVIHSTTPCPGDGKCIPARLPELAPCVEIGWGDGANDHLETDDWEVLCIRVCNPYNNVSFGNLILHLSAVLDGNGNPVKNLPDGTPSVFFKPSEQICFGDLGPCQEGRPNCVSREVVLITRGAIEGPYQIYLGFCFSVCLTYASVQQFKLDLVSS